MTDENSRVSGVEGWLVGWGLRLLVGLTLLVFSELVWQGRNLAAVKGGDWAALVGLYILLGALMLDVLARFQVGDLFGWLTAAGLYGLLQGALIAGTAFTDLPFSLVTRPLGLQTLGTGMLGLAYVYWLLTGDWTLRRVAILAAGGLAWGVWMRWSPLLPAGGYPAPAYPAAAIVTGSGLVVLGGLTLLAGRLTMRPVDCRLRRQEWLLIGAGLLLAFWRAAALANLDTLGAAILGGLAGYLLMLLFVLRREQRVTFVERAFVFPPASGRTLVGCVALWLAAGAAGYALPGTGPEGLPLRALTTALTLFGILWLPALSVGMGLRAFTRLFREGG